MKRKHEALGLLDTVETTTKKRTIELKHHTIEIAEIDDTMIGNAGMYMGPNQSQLEDPDAQVRVACLVLAFSAPLSDA